MQQLLKQTIVKFRSKAKHYRNKKPAQQTFWPTWSTQHVRAGCLHDVTKDRTEGHLIETQRKKPLSPAQPFDNTCGMHHADRQHKTKVRTDRGGRPHQMLQNEEEISCMPFPHARKRPRLPLPREEPRVCQQAY
jgi:hypothetical protein